VSYSLSLAADASRALASLEAWLQEETLDEIERLLHNPEQLTVRHGDVVAIHDFTRTHAGRTHYVFLTVRPDHPNRRLDVLRLGHHVR
jgi:hypothetical protein